MAFSEGDRVLCYHGPKIYEAKILKKKTEGGIEMFFVHYKGWKSKWDEWVNFERIVELDQEGLILQKKLAAEHKSNDKDFLQSLSLEDNEQNDTQKSEMPILFKLAKNFKHYANYDWMQVNKKSKILKTPADVTVDIFLKQYLESFPGIESKIDFVNSFIDYLDVFIGKNLLYRQERLNYLPIHKANKATQLYGPEILIRFFARLNLLLQEYSSNDGLSEFSSELSSISDHLMNYLSATKLDSAYTTRSDHYEAYYSIN